MDIQELKRVVNSGLPDDCIKTMLLNLLAKEDDAISIMATIVSERQKQDNALIRELNLMLSKAHVAALNPKLVNADTISKEIYQFYEKHKGQIGHCFNQ